MSSRSFTINIEDKGIRLDVFLAAVCDDLTRSRIQGLIKDDCVLVDDIHKRANYKLRGGEKVDITLPVARSMDIVAQDIPISIVYEDEDIVVVNKARGMVVHPAPGNYDNTLVNALMYHCSNLSGIGGVIRPGIVHRIDKHTTGLLVVAKNDIAHAGLAKQIKAKSAGRTYLCIVVGRVKEGGSVNEPIGRSRRDRKKMAVLVDGRQAISHYTVLKVFDKYTLLKVDLETGRTHQIRVHMAFMGHPVVGDHVYGVKKQRFNLKGQMLHAASLSLIHPITNEYMRFFAPLPDDFAKVIKTIGGDCDALMDEFKRIFK